MIENFKNMIKYYKDYFQLKPKMKDYQDSNLTKLKTKTKIKIKI